MALRQSGSSTQTFSILAALFLLVGLLGTYQFLLPRLKEANTALAESKAKNEGIQNDIATLEDAQTRMDAAKTALQSKGLDFNKLSAIYPHYEELPNLYIQMEYLTTVVPDVTASYQINPPTSDGPGNTKVPISINATGTYANLKTFLARLEDNLRPITFTSIGFAQAPDKDKDGKPIPGAASKLTMNASGYVRADQISPAYTPKK